MQAIALLGLEVRCIWGVLHSEKLGGLPQDGNSMNQRDGFSSGFIAGTVVGGVVGGLIGALLASQRSSELVEDTDRRNASLSQANSNRRHRRQFKAATPEQSIEIARRSLEDKIAQLNETIDEVRLTLGQVNGNQSGGNPEQTSLREDLR